MGTTWHVNTLTLVTLMLLFSLEVWLSLFPVAVNTEAQNTRQVFEYKFADLAGEYYSGDGCAVNATIKIRPDGTFVRIGSGCEGNQRVEQGSISLRKHRLELHTLFEYQANAFNSARSNFNRAPNGNEPELLCPVRWGKRMYLVSARTEQQWLVELLKQSKIDIDTADVNAFVGFSCDVNAGFEPRQALQGTAYIKIGDENKAAEGVPDLPACYLPYILKKPVKGEIVSIISCVRMQESPLMCDSNSNKGSAEKSTTQPNPPSLPGSESGEEVTAKVNVGLGSGIKRGMTLYVLSEEFSEKATVVSTDEASSVIKWNRYPFFHKHSAPPGVKGKVSSQLSVPRS